jgi:hypothetical protein
MVRLNANDARCEALFASPLQPSDALTAEAVADVIDSTARQLGPGGCAGRMAQEYGDHPEAAIERMRWARQLVGKLAEFPRPASAPTLLAVASAAWATAGPAAQSRQRSSSPCGDTHRPRHGPERLAPRPGRNPRRAATLTGRLRATS